MNAGAAQWWLVTQRPPSHPESKGDVEILREVREEEERQTREANALLNRLVSAAPYARLVELYEELEQALGREASPARRAADMNRAARALGKVTSELADDLRRHARDDFGPGSEKEQELEVPIADETERALFRLLIVGKLEQGTSGAATKWALSSASDGVRVAPSNGNASIACTRSVDLLLRRRVRQATSLAGWRARKRPPTNHLAAAPEPTPSAPPTSLDCTRRRCTSRSASVLVKACARAPQAGLLPTRTSRNQP